MQSEKLKRGDKVCVIAPSRSLGIISQQTISLAKPQPRPDPNLPTIGK